MIIADSLKRFRRDFNLSQTAVANALQIKPQSYAPYETKGVIPSIAVMSKLADIYGVSIDYLAGRTDNPDPIPNKHSDSPVKLSTEELNALTEATNNYNAALLKILSRFT